MTKSLGIVLESFHCVFSFILSHTYVHLYSKLAEKERNSYLALSGMLISLKKHFHVIKYGPHIAKGIKIKIINRIKIWLWTPFSTLLTLQASTVF